MHPAWSLDGDRLAFTGLPGGSRYVVTLVDVVNWTAQKLVEPIDGDVAGGLAVALSIALLAAACLARPPLQSEDPQVQAAQQACKDVPDPERFACIEQHAIATLNPDVCRLIGIAVDDACLQAVYEAADDPAICDRLYGPFVVPTCKAYYANPNRVPRLLTPTPLPDDARLGWLAYVLDGDIWIKYLPDGQPQRITDDGVNVSPRWSPSVRWLAFRKRDSQLWLHSLETG